MNARLMLLLFLSSGCASRSEVIPQLPPPPAIGAIEPAELHGGWIYAQDPTGVIPFDPVYDGATVRFEADGGYAYALGGEGSMGPLTGTWTVLEPAVAAPDELVYVVDFGEGRVTDPQRARLRRDEAGQVVALELLDGVSEGLLFVPDPSAP